MYKKNLSDCRGLTDEFIFGLEQFLHFACTQVDFMDGNKLRRPCRRCRNGKYLECDKVREHLCRVSFTPNYYNWTCYGEPFISDEEFGRNRQFSVSGDRSYYEQLNPYQRMVIDAVGPNFVPDPSARSSSFAPTFEHGYTSYASPLEEVEVVGVDQNLSNESSLQFQEVLRAADEPLWAGCDSHTKLSLTARLLNVKAERNVSRLVVLIMCLRIVFKSCR